MDLPSDCTGRAFVHEGTMYYSPNSENIITPPPCRSDNEYRFPVYECKLENFTSPQWWSSIYGWLAFVPTVVPQFDQTGLFSPLEDSNAWPVGENMLGIGEHRLQQWIRIENVLFHIILTLAERFQLLGFFKPAPIVSLRPRTKRNNRFCANEFVKSIRDWVVMWMALLSFMVARAGAQWSIELPKLGGGLNHTLLDQILGSAVCDFTSNSSRAGVFIDPLAQNQRSQPPIEFFVKFNIPVWYIWSAEHGKALVEKEKIPRHLLPSPTELRRAESVAAQTVATTTIPLALPSSSKSNNSNNANKSDYATLKERYIASKPWQPFFDERDLANVEREKKETPTTRQARLARARQPPTTRKTQAFVWDWDEHSTTPKLVRQPVSLGDWKENYLCEAAHHKKYCAFTNQWDYCEYFENDQEWARKENRRIAEWQDVEMNPGVTQLHPESSTESSTHAVTPLQREQDRLTHDKENSNRQCLVSISEVIQDLERETPPANVIWNKSDVLSCLYYRHGFLVPNTKGDAPVDPKRWTNAMGALCRLKTTPIDEAHGVHCAVVEFVESLSQQKKPNEDHFDLSAKNPNAIPPPDFWQMFERKGIWIILLRTMFQDCDPDSWQLAVSDVANAVFLFRLIQNTESREKPTRASLVKRLLELCIPFHTLDEGKRCTLDSVHCMVSYRLSGHHFTLGEYHHYVHMRRQFLTSSRGRAALLSGGIVARLAQEHIGYEEVLSGASLDALEYQTGVSYEDDQGHIYVDDALTKDELALICGLHYEYTGTSDEKKHLSWWPPHHQWMNQQSCGRHPRYWSELNEDWYQKRLEEILAGTAQPLTASTWLKLMRGIRQCVCVADTTSFLAAEYLK